jgi:hypothetical protein
MDAKRLLAITLVLVFTGSALTWARQRTGNLPPSPPFDLAPDPGVPSPFVEAPNPFDRPPSLPEPSSPVPSSVDVPASQAPVNAEAVLESRTFIDQGIAKAERAIESLSTERDRLRERIETIEEELARWEAVNRGLVSARQAKPGRSSEDEPRLSPPHDPGLEPLAETEAGFPLPPDEPRLIEN